jgi:hypothetical protein
MLNNDYGDCCLVKVFAWRRYMCHMFGSGEQRCSDHAAICSDERVRPILLSPSSFLPATRFGHSHHTDTVVLANTGVQSCCCGTGCAVVVTLLTAFDHRH